MLTLIWRRNSALPGVSLEWRGPNLITTEWIKRRGLTSLDSIETKIAVISGPRGPKGDTGDLNVSGTAAFTWIQNDAQTTWLIPHNLGRYPSVTVMDNAKRVIYGDVSYVDINLVQIDFAYPMSGTAYIV